MPQLRSLACSRIDQVRDHLVGDGLRHEPALVRTALVDQRVEHPDGESVAVGSQRRELGVGGDAGKDGGPPRIRKALHAA